MGLFDNLRRGIGQVPTNARSRGGMGGIFGNLMDRQRRSSILPKQPQSFAEFQQMQKEGSLFGGQLNPAPMDPSGTFQMGFGNMVPDAQTLEQLQQGIPGIPQIENGIIPIGSPDPRQIPSIGLPPLKRAIDAPGGGGIDYGGGSIDKILEDQILEDQRGGMRPPQQGMGPPLGEDDNRQGMGPPQQLLPPPPGFTPPTIGNPDGSGRDMGIAPPSFGGGRPPLAPPAMQQPVAPLAPPPLVPQGPQPIPMLPNETSVPFLPPMAPPKRNDFMSIAQDPNLRLREGNQAPIESGGQPGGQAVIDRGITGIANQRLNEKVVGERQPISRAPDQGGADRFSVNQLNPLPLEDRGYGPGITVTPDFMEEMKNRGPMDSKPPMDIAPPMEIPREIPRDIAPPMAPPRRSIAPPSFEREPREMPREAPTPPAQIEQIKQVLPQLPPEQLMDILPQLPPEVIQELPEELIRQIMPMMPEPMMPETMQPRMPMPGPIATPPPRLQRPSLPMMPMMGGRGRR